MSFKRELKKISELEVGDFNGYIIVRVERIIRVQQVCYPLGPHRPMIEPQGVHIIVFYGSKMKVLLLCENKNVLRRLGSMFAEERVLRMRDFEVFLNEATSGGTLYIKAKAITHVEHVLPSSPHYPHGLPIHCFDLVTISEVVERKARGRGLLDVCCKVVTCYERGMEVADDMDTREVVLVIEETGVLATRVPTMLTCIFHGQCADLTMSDYNRANKDELIIAVVMYAQLTKEDFPTLCEYNDATRTYFNPPFPELLEARKALVDRLSEMYNRNAIPMLQHSEEEPSGDMDNVYLS